MVHNHCGLHRLRKNSLVPDVLKGHGFSRAANLNEMPRVLTPEASFSDAELGLMGFPQPLQPLSDGFSAILISTTAPVPARSPDELERISQILPLFLSDIHRIIDAGILAWMAWTARPS
jgi:hypothetical protein